MPVLRPDFLVCRLLPDGGFKYLPSFQPCIVLIENTISISIECENGINFDQFLAREMVAIVARSAKQVLKIAGLEVR